MIYKKNDTGIKKLAINCSERIYILDLDDIIAIKAKASYSVFITTNKANEIISSSPISFYTKLLEKNGFFRCHRSFLVNLQHVAEIEKYGIIRMITGEDVPVTKENIKLLIKEILNFDEQGYLVQGDEE